VLVITGLLLRLSAMRHGTTTVWCIHCKERRLVVRRELVVETNSKGTSHRVAGQCLTCRQPTSTYVAGRFVTSMSHGHEDDEGLAPRA
jgi:hypothetical protein